MINMMDVAFLLMLMGKVIMDYFLMGLDMGKAGFILKMDLCLKETGKIIFRKDRVSWSIQMEGIMLENLIITKWMVKVFSLGRMEIYTVELSKLIKDMALECLHMLMVPNILVIGNMIKNMGWVLFITFKKK